MNHLNFSWVIDGKLAGHQAPSSEQDLLWLKKHGILALVRVAEKHKSQVSSGKVVQLGFLDCHEPVPDFTAPKPVQVDRLVKFIGKSLAVGRPVGVSCEAGLGRTGTILACCLVNQCYDADSAIDEIRTKGPGSIETKDQEDTVRAYAKRVGKA